MFDAIGVYGARGMEIMSNFLVDMGKLNQV